MQNLLALHKRLAIQPRREMRFTVAAGNTLRQVSKRDPCSQCHEGSGQVHKKGAGIWGRGEPVTAFWKALQAAQAAWEGRDGEHVMGRKEARFQSGLNPTQRSLGFIQ